MTRIQMHEVNTDDIDSSSQTTVRKATVIKNSYVIAEQSVKMEAKSQKDCYRKEHTKISEQFKKQVIMLDYFEALVRFPHK